MNPNDSDESQDTPPIIQLRITGPWSTSDELTDALDKLECGYKLGLDGIVHIASGQRFGGGATPHDDEIAELFAQTGRLSDQEIADIAAHAVKVHLSASGGSVEAARAIVNAASALLHAGGTGVFVDNGGLAHSKSDWLKLAGDIQPGGLYWLFVIGTGDEDEIWSVGMHCLGFRDAEFPNPPSRELGGFMLHNFLGYTYQSGNPILDGDVIGDESQGLYRIRHVPCTRFPADTPFHNPYGVWRLEEIDEDAEEDD